MKRADFQFFLRLFCAPEGLDCPAGGVCIEHFPGVREGDEAHAPSGDDDGRDNGHVLLFPPFTTRKSRRD